MFCSCKADPPCLYPLTKKTGEDVDDGDDKTKIIDVYGKQFLFLLFENYLQGI